MQLLPHPDTPARAIHGVSCDLVRGTRELRLDYRVHGSPDALLVPEPAAAERTDELWKTTCFELFIKPAGGEAYVEFNFSPSTRWAAYAFDRYRGAMRALPLASPPRIERHANGWSVALAAEELPTSDWRVALTSVIEERDGHTSYWSLAHGPGKPDFHHDACFALAIPAPGRP